MLYAIWIRRCGQSKALKKTQKKVVAAAAATTQMRVPSEVIPIEALAVLATTTASTTRRLPKQRRKKCQVWVIKNVAADQQTLLSVETH